MRLSEKEELVEALDRALNSPADLRDVLAALNVKRRTNLEAFAEVMREALDEVGIPL